MAAPVPLLLSLEHVTVLRGAREQRSALDDITPLIPAGEHVCILGPNGCGKSTLIKTITRECYPLAREGSSISILGRERWNIFELRSKLGIVSPDLLASCTTDATGRDGTWCFRDFSAAREFFRITIPTPRIWRERTKLWQGSASRIWRSARSRRCPRAKRSGR